MPPTVTHAFSCTSSWLGVCKTNNSANDWGGENRNRHRRENDRDPESNFGIFHLIFRYFRIFMNMGSEVMILDFHAFFILAPTTVKSFQFFISFSSFLRDMPAGYMTFASRLHFQCDAFFRLVSSFIFHCRRSLRFSSLWARLGWIFV